MTHATKAIYRWLLSDYVKVRYTKALVSIKQHILYVFIF